MILEGVVTTRNSDGRVNLAPMGPRLEVDENGRPRFDRFLLRPFQSSTTFANLARDRQGVLHIVDDVLLMARAAIGVMAETPAMHPAAQIAGFVLDDCCRAFEFVIDEMDVSEERSAMEARVVHVEYVRDCFGFNRAKHAVIEAAILATRRHLIEREELKAAWERLVPLVEKTGGPAEHAAFRMLTAYVEAEDDQ